MPFQFYCPHGHLLQGEETQIGQPCMCPYCQTEFMIPAPAGGPANPAATPVIPPEEPYYGQEGSYEEEYEEEPPVETREDRAGASEFFGFGSKEQGGEEQDVANAGRVGDRVPDVEAPQNIFERKREKATPGIFHIPCPNGHILETPEEMLNQEAICPECEREFVLRWEKSIEGMREQATKQERHDRKIGNAWMNWAIAAAVIVVFGVLVMIGMIVAS